MIRSFRDLRVWQESYDLSVQIHKLTLRFPEFERPELGRQMRSASRSVPVNIAEGYGRRSYEKEFRRFLIDSVGSCDEMHVHLLHARDFGYVTPEVCEELQTRYTVIGKQLSALIKRWRSNED
jgi:four helix bundle protein